MQDTHIDKSGAPKRGQPSPLYVTTIYNRYVPPPFIQTDLRLQGEADGEERESVCEEMRGEKKDSNGWILRNTGNSRPLILVQSGPLTNIILSELSHKNHLQIPGS